MTSRYLLMATACYALVASGAGAQQAATVPRDLSPRGVAPWAVIDAIGYGGLGLGAGFVFAFAESEAFGPTDAGLVAMGASTLAGIVGGAYLGRRARARIASGQTVSGGHRLAVSTGAVLAGAMLGALIAMPLIAPEGEDTTLGSDESTAMLTVGAGTALGLVYATRHQRDFIANRVGVSPYVNGRTGTGLRLEVRF